MRGANATQPSPDDEEEYEYEYEYGEDPKVPAANTHSWDPKVLALEYSRLEREGASREQLAKVAERLRRARRGRPTPGLRPTMLCTGPSAFCDQDEEEDLIPYEEDSEEPATPDS